MCCGWGIQARMCCGWGIHIVLSALLTVDGQKVVFLLATAEKVACRYGFMYMCGKVWLYVYVWGRVFRSRC